jgi:WD40 repeat protein
MYLLKPENKSSTPVAPPDLGAVLHALWSDKSSPRAVFTAGHHASVARLGSDDSLMIESRFNLGEGRLNRTGLWHGGPTITRFTPDGERLLFIRDREMELRHPAKPKALLQAEFPQPIRDAAFSPDYEHLFVLDADGALYVCNPGSLTGVRARFRWHLGPVWRLAVSPDGQMLATAGSEGVKLWPISQLLPLLE